MEGIQILYCPRPKNALELLPVPLVLVLITWYIYWLWSSFKKTGANWSFIVERFHISRVRYPLDCYVTLFKILTGVTQLIIYIYYIGLSLYKICYLWSLFKVYGPLKLCNQPAVRNDGVKEMLTQPARHRKAKLIHLGPPDPWDEITTFLSKRLELLP